MALGWDNYSVMIRIICLLLVSSFSFGACNSEKNEKQLQSVLKSLESSNRFIDEYNDLYITILEQRDRDPYNYQVARPVFKRAKNIMFYSNRTKAYIEILKKNANSLSKCSSKLFDSLLLARQAMLKSTEPADTGHLRLVRKDLDKLFNSLPLLAGLPDSSGTNMISFRKNWINNNITPGGGRMNEVVLRKLENDLLMTTNKLLEYCNKSFTSHSPCIRYMPIATISSSYVRAGDSIEVNVGIGAFDGSVNPKIFIDGSPIDLNFESVAVHFVKAKGKPGKHSIPIQVEFTEPDGTKKTMSKKFTYTILQ